MPLPTIANTCRVAIRGTQSNGQPWANVLHFRKTAGSIDTSAINALHTEIAKLYGGPAYTGGQKILNSMPTATLALDATYTPLDGVSSSTVKSFSGVTGGSAGDSLPGQDSMICTLRTGNRGRSYRGRVYLPTPTETAPDSQGNLSATPIANTDAQWAGFMTALTALNWQLVVASYTVGVATSVTLVQTRNYLAHMTRRRN